MNNVLTQNSHFVSAVLASTLAFSACQSSENLELTTPSNLDQIAEHLDVKYTLLANRWGEACTLPNSSVTIKEDPCFEAKITLTSDIDIPRSDFQIFFSQVEPTHAASSETFDVQHLNGDLHVISPKPAFTGFKANAPVEIPFIVAGQVFVEAKLMPNYFLTAPNLEPKIINSTRLETDPDTGLTIRPYVTPFGHEDRFFKKNKSDNIRFSTAESIFAANERPTSPVNYGFRRHLIPSPYLIEAPQSAPDIQIKNGYRLVFENLVKADVAPALNRLGALGFNASTSGIAINARLDPQSDISPEGYELSIADDQITISAADKTGVLYAFMSIAGLINPEDQSLPQVKIQDRPQFEFRGLHVDVARNFQPKSEVLKILDQMAAYKLNKLHLHLADDEGWRLEIPGLDELTQVGAYRCHDPEEKSCLLPQLGAGPFKEARVNGYYTVADYQEILRYAEARHIEVIPSLDMPGHARAAVTSMEARYNRLASIGNLLQAEEYLLHDLADTSEYSSIQYYKDNTINPCLESPYRFFEKVLDELIKMHDQAGQVLEVYHIGADETAGAWTSSPACVAFFKSNEHGVTKPEDLGPYFIRRVSAIINSKGLTTGAWNDGLENNDPEKLPKNIHSNVWGTLFWNAVEVTHKHLNHDWDVVLSLPDVLYFDMPHEVDPKEGGYYWAARKTNTRKVFDFMPNNLPVNAEISLDREGNPFEINDTHPREAGQNIKGIQGQIWSETIHSADQLEYQVFPRLLALAERAWHKADWEPAYNLEGGIYGPNSDVTAAGKTERDADWELFAQTLGQKEFAKLDALNVFYRIPTPGAKIEDGLLKANIAFPGLPIEYRSGNGPWQSYAGPTPVSGIVEIRARSANGNRAGRLITLEAR